MRKATTKCAGILYMLKYSCWHTWTVAIKEWTDISTQYTTHSMTKVCKFLGCLMELKTLAILHLIFLQLYEYLVLVAWPLCDSDLHRPIKTRRLGRWAVRSVIWILKLIMSNVQFLFHICTYYMYIFSSSNITVKNIQ